jgi:hypothetical protein
MEAMFLSMFYLFSSLTDFSGCKYKVSGIEFCPVIFVFFNFIS